ncbi:hypothetical protein [Spirosoma harenae]
MQALLPSESPWSVVIGAVFIKSLADSLILSLPGGIKKSPGTDSIRQL